jgi:glycine/sarcosine N-methyltransferase
MYQSITPYYKEIFPLKEVTLSFVRSLLKGTSCHVLDIGCAVGQLAAALAREGHTAAGIDLDASMIETARKDTANLHLKVNFQAMDMMLMDAHFAARSFAMALCLGNTMVHLQSLEEIGQFIKKVFAVLKNQGTFIIQVVNYDHILAGEITELPVINTPHVLFQRHYDYDPVRHRMHFQTSFTLKEEETLIEDEVLLYPLTHSELDTLIKDAGFSEAVYYGDFSANKYTHESPALIAVARRP